MYVYTFCWEYLKAHARCWDNRVVSVAAWLAHSSSSCIFLTLGGEMLLVKYGSSVSSDLSCESNSISFCKVWE